MKLVTIELNAELSQSHVLFANSQIHSAPPPIQPSQPVGKSATSSVSCHIGSEQLPGVWRSSASTPVVAPTGCASAASDDWPLNSDSERLQSFPLHSNVGTLPSLLPPNGHRVGCGGGLWSRTRINTGMVESLIEHGGVAEEWAGGGRHRLCAVAVGNKAERHPTVPRTEEINETDRVIGFSPIATSLGAVRDVTGSLVSASREAVARLCFHYAAAVLGA